MGADKLIIGKIAIRKTTEQLKKMDEEIMLMEQLTKNMLGEFFRVSMKL